MEISTLTPSLIRAGRRSDGGTNITELKGAVRDCANVP